MRRWLFGVSVVVTIILGMSCYAKAEAVNKQIPKPLVDSPAAEAHGQQVAVFAGGCFWGLQGMFEHVRGVSKVVAGYSGGDKATAHYEMVGTETTGHGAELSVGDLLRVAGAGARRPRVREAAHGREGLPAADRDEDRAVESVL